MPRIAKEKIDELEKKSTSSKQQSTHTKTKPKKTVSKKTTPSKAKSSTNKKNSTSKKAPVKKETAKKVSTTKKSRTTNSKNVKTKKIEILEYYDLPYRYNETIIKVLAQTPSTLFVYWDISDEDKNQYIKQYGEFFFNNTKPVLIIHNRTKNYSYEVDINDFANSWYLNVTDSNCDYQIELGRRPINNFVNIENNYMYITKSNQIESPNDHILFDELSHFVYFKNIKTNSISKKDVTSLTLINKFGKINSIKAFYKKLYPEETINFEKLDLRNPSSNF